MVSESKSLCTLDTMKTAHSNTPLGPVTLEVDFDYIKLTAELSLGGGKYKVLIEYINKLITPQNPVIGYVGLCQVIELGRQEWTMDYYLVKRIDKDQPMSLAASKKLQKYMLDFIVEWVENNESFMRDVAKDYRDREIGNRHSMVSRLIARLHLIQTEIDSLSHGKNLPHRKDFKIVEE